MSPLIVLIGRKKQEKLKIYCLIKLFVLSCDQIDLDCFILYKKTEQSRT